MRATDKQYTYLGDLLDRRNVTPEGRRKVLHVRLSAKEADAWIVALTRRGELHRHAECLKCGRPINGAMHQVVGYGPDCLKAMHT